MKLIYIVTGANGHLGNTIVRKLVEKGNTVRCLMLPSDKVQSLNGVNCEIYFGDVTDKQSLQKLFDVPTDAKIIVIHCAAIVSIASKFNAAVYNVNVNGTKNMADISLEKQVLKFVHVSSVHAIPEAKKHAQMSEISTFSKDNVHGLYAKTKAEATAYVLQKAREGLNACVLHPSGIIGPNDFGRGHLTQLIVDYLSGRLNTCVKGGYDFVDARDVADGVINAVSSGRKGECYILSNEYMPVRELLNILSEIAGKKRIKSVLPMWLAKATAPFAEAYYKMLKQPPLFTKYSLFTLSVNSNFSHEKATRELNYNPRALRETLEDTAKWLNDHGRIAPKKMLKKKFKKPVSTKI